MKLTVAMIGFCLVSAGMLTAAESETTCVTCHSQLGGSLAKPVELFRNDVHQQAGLTCSDCHGGDPRDATMDAMSPLKGFRHAPKRTQIPEFCARCHSDPAYMRKFNPRLRTDQYSEYLTSMHGKRLRQGDTKVAVCVDCHSVHNILAVSEPQSPVYPTNVPATCAHCHADAATMKAYGIPTNQYALYEKSVHAQDLASGDTSAPTCATCHGNHGAAPPGVSSVANVCGTCHAMNQQLLDKSPHGPAFARMGLPGCVACHSNHEVVEPADVWVSTNPGSLCLRCHTAGDAGFETARGISDDLAHLKDLNGQAEEILSRAERSGMEVSSALLALTEAHTQLIKARVNVHTFNEAAVRQDTGPAMDIAQKAYVAGVAALRERDLRRKGLAVSLIFIFFVIISLFLKIRQIEARAGGRGNGN